jgi:hypothetical protein
LDVAIELSTASLDQGVLTYASTAAKTRLPCLR